MSWKIKTRKTCLLCGSKIKTKRFRTFCSGGCRVLFHSRKHAKQSVAWQRNKQDKIASVPSPGKVKCLVCNRWYVQVGTHIRQRHKMSARQYRELYDLPVKRGILPTWFRIVKASQVTKKALSNLKHGKKFWYKPGDIRAKTKTGWSGQSKKLNKLSQDIYPH